MKHIVSASILECKICKSDKNLRPMMKLRKNTKVRAFCYLCKDCHELISKHQKVKKKSVGYYIEKLRKKHEKENKEKT